MSQTIDQKVVEMKFDNSNFESNVKESMSTLDKLKSSLDLEGSAEGFKNISKAAREVSFDGLNGGIEDVKVHFSSLEVIGKRVLENITDSAVQTGLSMAKSFSTDLIGSGFKQYEDKTNAVQTIMNATGLSIDEVDNRLSKLIWYADETSYSFNDMVNNLGKFTSAGVDIDRATNAMMGISNWAAVSGVNARDASRAFYNLSQAMAQGVVMKQDWNSIAGLNMNTKEFNQTVIDTAVSLGKLDSQARTFGKGTQITAENLGATLSEKWFTSDVLIATLAKYSEFTDLVYERVEQTGESCSEAMAWVAENMGDSYDQIGKKAFAAGQEAKTFSDAIDAVKDAVKSQWATLFESAFGNYDEAKTTFTNMANSLYEVFATPLGEFNDTVKEAMNPKGIDLSAWTHLRTNIQDTMELSDEQMLQFRNVLKQVAKDHGIDIDEMIKQNGSFDLSMKEGWLNSDMLKEAVDIIQNGTDTYVKNLDEYQDVVNRVWAGEFGVGEERKQLLEAAGYDYEEIQRLVELGYGAEITLEDLGDTAGNLTGLFGEDLVEAFRNSADGAEELQKYLQYVSGRDLRNGFFDNIFNDETGAIVTYVNAFREAFHEIFGTLDSGVIHDVLAKLYEWSLKLLDEERVESFKTTVTNIFHGIHAGFEIVKGAFSVVKAAWDNTLGPLLSGAWEIVKTIVSGLLDLLNQADSATGSITAFSTAVEWLNEKLAPVKRTIEAVTGGIKTFFEALFDGKSVLDAIEDAFSYIVNELFGKNKDGLFDLLGQQEAEEKIKAFHETIEKLKGIGESIAETIKNIGETISEFWTAFLNTDLGQSITGFVERIGSALSTGWETVKTWVKGLFSSDDDEDLVTVGAFETIQNAITNFNTWLDDLDATEMAEKVSDFFTNFKEKAKSAFSSVKTWFETNETIQGAVSAVKGKFEELKEAIKSNDEDEDDGEKEPFLTRVLGVIKTTLAWILDNLPSLEEVIQMITGILTGTAVASLVNLIIQVKNLFSGGAGIATNISKVLSGVSKALNGFALSMVGSAIWDIAKSFALSFAVIVAGLVALTLVDQDKLATAGIVMLGVGAGITVLATALAKVFSTLKENKKVEPKKIGEAISDGIQSISGAIVNKINIGTYSSAILKVAISIGILVASMVALSKISWEDCAKGLITIAALLAEMIATIKLMGGDKKIAVDSGALMALSAAVMGFADSIKKIAQYSWDEIFRGIVTIGAILLEMTVFARYSKDVKVSTGVSMIAMAAAMLIFVQSIKQISQYTDDELVKSVVTIGIIFMEMAFATQYTKSIGFGGMVTVLALAGMMLIFCESIAKLSVYSWDQLLLSVATIGAILAEIALFANFTKDIKVSFSVIALSVSLGATMLIFAKAIASLSQYSWDQLLLSVAAIGAIFAEIALFARFMKDVKVSFSIIALAVSMGATMLLFAQSISVIADYRWDQILAAVLAMGAVMAEVALFAKVFSGIEMSFGQGVAIAAISAAVMSFAMALKTLSDIPWQSLLSGAAAIAGILLSIAGAAALLSHVSTSMETISKLLIGLAALIAAVSLSIVLVAKALEGVNIDDINTNIGQLVSNLVSSLVEGIVGSIDSIVGGIVQMLSSLAENAPQMVDILVGLVVDLLNMLAERMPELAGALANFCGALITSFADAFQNVDITPLATVIQNLLIATMALALVGEFGSFKGVTKGLGMLAEVIAGFGLIVAAFAALNLIPGFAEFMAGGVDILVTIADGIGSFVGTLIGSAVEGFTSSMPQIGTYLSEFMENAKGFIDGASGIDSTFLDAIGYLSLAMLEISGANFVDSVLNGLSWLFGGGTSGDFMSKFVDLGEALASFAESISDVDFSTVENAACAASIIGSLVDIVPRSGGLWQSIVGEKNFENIDENFGNLGKGVAAFCDSLSGVTIDQSAADAAGMAASIIQNLMDKAVPSTGGLWQKIVGEKDVTNAGTNFENIGNGVKEFCSAIDGITISDSTVTTAGLAADIIANIMSKAIPDEGGLWQKIVGEKDVENAGDNFKNIGEGIASFCTAIEGVTINQDTVTTAGLAADAIAEIMDKAMPNEGGLWQKIVGEKDMDNAGDNFRSIGEGVAAFCDAISDVDVDVTSASAAADVIAKLMSDALPATGGLWQEIAGQKDPAQAPENFKHLGEGVANFCSAIADSSLSSDSVDAASSAADIIGTLIDLAPSTGGIWQDIVGEKDLGKFGDNLGLLGTGAAAYIEATGNTTKSQMQRGKIAAQGLIDIINLEWPATDSGLFGWVVNGLIGGSTDFETLGGWLQSIATMAVDTANAYSGISLEQLTFAKDASQAVIDILNLEWPSTNDGGLIGIIGAAIGGSDQTDFSKIGGYLNDIGTAVTSFSLTVQGLTDDVVTNSQTCVSVITTFASLTIDENNSLADLPTYAAYIKVLGSYLSEYYTSISEINFLTVAASIAAIKALVDVLTTMADVDFDQASAFSDALGDLADAGITKFSDAFTNSVETVKTDVTTFLSDIVTAITDTESDFTTAGEGSFDAYQSGFEEETRLTSLKDAAGSAATDAAGAMDLDTDFTTAGSNDIGYFQSAFIDEVIMQNLINTAQRVAQQLPSNMENEMGFRRAGSINISSYEQGITSNAGGLNNTVGDIAIKAAEVFGSYQQWFYVSGWNCMVGIINGLADVAPTLYEHARAYGEGAVASFNAGAGVASPSWKFAESARYCIQGAVQGFEKNAHLLDEAAAETGQSSVDIMRDIMSGLNFEGMDDTLTIRPVLDLSDVQNGASQINEMLGADSAIGLDAIEAQRLANNINKLDMDAAEINGVYDDSNVIAVLTDLGDRVDNLNTAINNMKLYINGQTLVGGILNDMDKALGSLSSKKNAGVL